MHEVQLVIAQVYNSQMDADMAIGMLESAGIDAMIQADTVGGQRPQVAWANGGFKVLVREEDVEAARNVLELPESDA